MDNKNVSKIYNVTNPEIVSWGAFITKCGEVVGKSPIIKKIDINQMKLEARSYFPFRDVTYMLDIKKLIQDGLYIPTITLENGLKQTYQWYIDKNPSLKDVRMMSKVDELVTDYKLDLRKET
jgi:nucleoside-diphosphate-sugar epimerase